VIGAIAVRSNLNSSSILRRRQPQKQEMASGNMTPRSGPYTARSIEVPSLILGLQREALAGISAYAGNYRPGGVAIEGSKHEPVGAHLVPELVEDMCDYVNDHWDESTPIHLAAYLMWRLNWIHPFADGNGRTSRIISYVVLSIRAGAILPGTPTIPDQIVDNRNPYFDALDAADSAYRDGKIDVSKMEGLLAALLAKQLAGFYQAVGGKLPE
jgi:Fic family protein